MSTITDSQDMLGEAQKRLRSIDLCLQQARSATEGEANEALQGVDYQLRDVFKLIRRSRTNLSEEQA